MKKYLIHWLLMAPLFLMLHFASTRLRDPQLDSPEITLRSLLQTMRSGNEEQIGAFTTKNGWNELYKIHDDTAAKNYAIYKTLIRLGAKEDDLKSPAYIWRAWAMWARTKNTKQVAWHTESIYKGEDRAYAIFSDVTLLFIDTHIGGWRLHQVIHKDLTQPSSTHTTTKRNK